MGNSVGIINDSNIIINVALCVVAPYYEANRMDPGFGGQWDNVGDVFFTVVTVPWYGPKSEFGHCIAAYNDYRKRIPQLAKAISTIGEAQLEYIKITGKNVSQAEATERLKTLAFYRDGFKAAGKIVKVDGGPLSIHVSQANTIDISQPFDKMQVTLEDPSEEQSFYAPPDIPEDKAEQGEESE